MYGSGFKYVPEEGLFPSLESLSFRSSNRLDANSGGILYDVIVTFFESLNPLLTFRLYVSVAPSIWERILNRHGDSLRDLSFVRPRVDTTVTEILQIRDSCQSLEKLTINIRC